MSDDIVDQLKRCDPHDTDEVIKHLNAAAREIQRMRHHDRVMKYYSPMSQADIDAFCEIIRRNGVHGILCTLADHATQTGWGSSEFSLLLGVLTSEARKCER